MHFSDPTQKPLLQSGKPWWTELNRYHWFVLVVAALGWMFDCLDQQLFILARQPAMSELLPVGWNVDTWAGYTTSVFLMGWASGGLIFGVLGDRIGRAKTMMITILLYSLFTGLSALSQSVYDFMLFRFLTGLGVGGEFAVGVALVAEVMPERARPYTLATLQALSAVGNVTAAVIGMTMGGLLERGLVSNSWRPMFVVGAIPALLALIIRRRLKEPERWERATHEGAVANQLGSYRALFQHPTWRKNALLGLAMAFSGVVGLWAVGFFTMDFVGNITEARFVQDSVSRLVGEGKLPADNGGAIVREVKLEGLKRSELAKQIPEDTRREIRGQVGYWKAITSMMINVGAFIGMYTFGFVTQRIGRKPTFAIAFVTAALSTAAVLLFLDDFSQIFWMVPLMGVCQLSLFAGYAIYFPELFPTHLRSTGTSFCYNVGRFVAAIGPFMLGLLISSVFDGPRVDRLRYAGLTMCSVFLVGLLALPFAPETKGKPLPE
jgi:MFS family permease